MEDLTKSVYDNLRSNSKYENISDYDLQDVVVDCGYLYCKLKNVIADKVKRFNGTELNWIKKACKEILDRQLLDLPSGVKEYSESVYRIVFDSSYISKSLIDEVVPFVYALTESDEIIDENDASDDTNDDASDDETNDDEQNP